MRDLIFSEDALTIMRLLLFDLLAHKDNCEDATQQVFDLELTINGLRAEINTLSEGKEPAPTHATYKEPVGLPR